MNYELGKRICNLAAFKLGRPLPYPKNSTGMSEETGSEGAMLTQSQLVQPLMKALFEKSVLLSRITMIPVGQDFNGVNLPALAETSRANGQRHGGTLAALTAEGAEITPTNPLLRLIALKLEKYICSYFMTDELMNDAAAMEAWLTKIFSDETSWNVDNDIINGPGLGGPLGILNSPALVTVDAEESQGSTIVFENVLGMWERLAPACKKRAVWLIGPGVFRELATMGNIAGSDVLPVFTPANGPLVEGYLSLFARPIIECEFCQVLGKKGDILVCDMSDVVGIDKGKMETETSLQLEFMSDRACIKTRYRFNSCPYTSAPITPFRGGDTVSPYVTLAERAGE
jgi:HK97 family phage major capsid protein